MGWKPKRLLVIRKPRNPRLVLSSQETVAGEYATLSHCWGTKQDFLKLTSDTEASMVEGIPFTSLPKTFKDAIITAKRLGISYIWIDSLCIIQAGKGSARDWEEQVKDMPNIYQNCAINIAADRATDPHAGAFAERQPSVLDPCQLITGGEGERLYIILDDVDLTGAYFDAPLTQRGWVFQERILSPRVVHLGMDQLWWEFTDIGFASEFLPTGLPRDHPLFRLGEAPFKIVEPVEKPTAGVNSSCTKLSMTHKWHRMVTHYSTLKLTVPEKNVFAALSGIAERYAALLDDEYLAGHFLSMMPQDLCWSSAFERSRTLSYQAPTWSWASTFQSWDSLRWFSRDTKALASIVSHKVELLDQENPYGPIRYAEITLSALLLDCFRLDGHPAIHQHDKVLDDPELECVVDFDPGDPLAPMLNPKGTDQIFSLPTWGFSKVVSEIMNPALFKDMPTNLSFLTPYIDVHPDERDFWKLSRALVLPVMYSDSRTVSGLVVQQVPTPAGRPEGQYVQRIGAFESRWADNDLTAEGLTRLHESGVVPLRDITLI